MKIMLIGLNHRTAPVEVREQLAFSHEGAATALFLFCKQFPQAEAAILSTCNRVEMIIASESEQPSFDEVVSFLAQARDVPVPAFKPYLYQYHDQRAVHHLFHVAASLDSMVIGEYQIVNQLKAAYAQASEQGAVSRVLNRLFHQAFHVSKRIRTETEIGLRKVSVPSVAVDVARGIFDDFSRKNVLVLGAGDMAQIVCEHLRKADARHFTVASRTVANARALATACDGRCVPWSQIDNELLSADIVITATSCPKPIITADKLRDVQARRKASPMFFIDLAVPRNVEAACEQINQVYVYDVDAIGRIIETNRQHRAAQVEQCEAIIEYELDQFAQWQKQNATQPLIQQMFADAYALRDQMLDKLMHDCPDLTERQQKAVQQVVEQLIGKFMHPCACTVKQCGPCEKSSSLPDALHEVARRKSTKPNKPNK